MREQALVADLLRQRVREAIAESRTLAGLANQAGCREPADGRREIDVRTQHVAREARARTPGRTRRRPGRPLAPALRGCRDATG